MLLELKRPSELKMSLEDALYDAIDSPCEPIAWKRSRLEDSEIPNHNSLFDENWDFNVFHDAPILKFNTSIESQETS